MIDLYQNKYNNKKALTSVSTTMTKAQSIFIGCSTHTQPLLQEQISSIDMLWERNDNVLDCRRCHKQFNFIIRRHHCRKCGQIVCDTCSTQRVYLPPTDIIQPYNIPIHDLHILSMQPQRICDSCDIVKKKSNNAMLECPVCTKNLTEYNTIKEQEQHVQACLTNGPSSSSNIGIRFVGK